MLTKTCNGGNWQANERRSQRIRERKEERKKSEEFLGETSPWDFANQWKDFRMYVFLKENDNEKVKEKEKKNQKGMKVRQRSLLNIVKHELVYLNNTRSFAIFH